MLNIFLKNIQFESPYGALDSLLSSFAKYLIGVSLLCSFENHTLILSSSISFVQTTFHRFMI